MSLAKRFRLLLKVVPVVAALLLVKLGAHALNFEFVTINGLIPSLVAGAIFLIGFLLSHVLSDYKEAERMPSEIRATLEAIHDDVASFAAHMPSVDMAGLRKTLVGIVSALETSLGVKGGHKDLAEVEARVDGLSPLFVALERMDMSERYIVRLRTAQDALRRTMFRISYMQRMEFVPSAHVLVQTLVGACLILILLIKTSGSYESFLILGFVSYLFVYAVFLIEVLEEPFRTGEGSVDDVSLFLLREFVAKLEKMGR